VHPTAGMDIALSGFEPPAVQPVTRRYTIGLMKLDTYGCITTSSSGMLPHVALVRPDISDELSASIVRVTIIGELGTMLAVGAKFL
jgi:hypothetical protein